jgi:hypothetical protein
MTPLRQRMLEDMRLAGFAQRTRDVYIQAVRRLAAHYKRSPDLLNEEEVRTYLLHLRDARGVARGTFKTNHGGIRFLYGRDRGNKCGNDHCVTAGVNRCRFHFRFQDPIPRRPSFQLFWREGVR